MLFPLISVPAGKENRCPSSKKKSALSCKKRRTGGLYIRKKCESPPVFFVHKKLLKFLRYAQNYTV